MSSVRVMWTGSRLVTSRQYASQLAKPFRRRFKHVSQYPVSL